jgi:hypothetical protein
MEDISPSRPAKVDLLAPSDGNKSDKPDNNRPRRRVNPKPPPRALPEPLLDTDGDKDEKHQLDELA